MRLAIKDLFTDEISYRRAIVAMTQAVIISLDAEGTILDCNTYMEKLSGQSTDRLIGRNWRDILVVVEDQGPAVHLFPPDMDKKDPRTELYLMPCRDGTECYLEFNFQVIKDDQGRFAGMLLVGYDVSNRVRYERQLIRERSELIQKNKELTCLYAIANLADDDTLALGQLIQSIAELIPPVFEHPDATAAAIHLDQAIYATRAIQAGQPALSEPILVQGIERGKIEVVDCRAQAQASFEHCSFREKERHLIKTLARHLAFIIEKRDAQTRRRELERQLRHADRLATIGQLAAGVAHELNEPLANILGFAQLAEKAPALAPQVAADLARIVQASLHAREIIKKLMLFGRPMPPRQTAVNLNQWVDDQLYFLEARCIKQGIRIVRELDGQLPLITADPSQMQQVLVNLVINAISAMPGGGVLTISTHSDKIFAYLRVMDTGIGIEPVHLNRIFDPFFTTKDVDEGTGLGLSVVHGIVSAHQGRIEVQSCVGQGSTFTVALPLMQKKRDP
jgi:PAS domain S-box-containing protein